MIPNNNLSVLPWYTSIDQQNARKWWVYGRVFPLFTPSCYLPPFQVSRDSETTIQYTKGSAIGSSQGMQDTDIAINEGLPPHLEFAEGQYDEVRLYNVSGKQYVYLENLPESRAVSGYSPANVVFIDNEDNVLAYYDLPENTAQGFTGGLAVPSGAAFMWIQYTLAETQYTASVYNATAQIISTPVSLFKIYTKDGALVSDISATMAGQITIKPVSQDTDVLVYTAALPFAVSFNEGQYYAEMSDGTNTWYSEVFTMVQDIAPYLKIEWWDNQDFVMDAGTIVYTNPDFKNILYLNAEIAKPEYPFEEEGETRDGYFFPIKMISEKRYRFKFFASEYLLDVMRFIRMADFAQITANGQVYSLDTFLITPEWEAEGDVASVEAQFDTATVAKKIGVGYIKAQN